METTTKTWDQFIARQVEAALKQERMSDHCYAYDGIAPELMRGNYGTKGPATGLVWRWNFGGTNYWNPSECWYVNLTQKKVLLVRRAY